MFHIWYITKFYISIGHLISTKILKVKALWRAQMSPALGGGWNMVGWSLCRKSFCNHGPQHIASMDLESLGKLVGALEHVYTLFIFHFINGIILPIDELHHFSRWLLHHQPESGNMWKPASNRSGEELWCHDTLVDGKSCCDPMQHLGRLIGHLFEMCSQSEMQVGTAPPLVSLFWFVQPKGYKKKGIDPVSAGPLLCKVKFENLCSVLINWL